MSLFKKTKEENKPENHQVELDFLIHNMPLSSDSGPAKAATNSKKSSNKDKGSYKKVGLLIISAGIILILVLAYFGYNLIFNNTGQPSSSNLNEGSNSLTSSSSSPNELIGETDNQSQTAATTSASSTVGNLDGLASSTLETEASSSLEVIVEVSTSTPDLIEETPSSTSSFVGEDSDADGLSDASEAVLGTSQYLADSDSDSYLDLSEIKNGYNPSGSGKIGEGGYLDYYYNPTYNYRIMYPKLWGQKNIGGDSFSIFDVPDGSLVQISVQENARKQDIISWYRQEFSFFDTFDQNRLIRTAGSDQGIFSADGLSVYLTDADKNYIYILSFVPVSEGELGYFQIFQLMMESFEPDYQIDIVQG